MIGLCLPFGVLRRLVNKGLRGKALADDYELHVGAVAECSSRNRASVMLKKALDQRYCAVLYRFKGARDADAVMTLWLDAKRAGDMAGAFWAALTHPRSDFRLQDTLLREIHMIQHQAGAGARIDPLPYRALREEHAALTRVQDRQARTLADKMREVSQLGAQLMQARADLIVRDSAMSFLREDMEQLAASIPELEARTRLQQKLDRAAQREHARDIQVRKLRRDLAAALQHGEALSTALPAAQPEPVEAAAGVRLDDKTVLCVGGRSGNIPIYRGMTEQTGAQFVHHGVENPSSSSFSGGLKRIALVADA